jgi:hypothetical protein
VADDAFWQILRRGLAKKPEDRFQSSSQLGLAWLGWLGSICVDEDCLGVNLDRYWPKTNPRSQRRRAAVGLHLATTEALPRGRARFRTLGLATLLLGVVALAPALLFSTESQEAPVAPSTSTSAMSRVVEDPVQNANAPLVVPVLPTQTDLEPAPPLKAKGEASRGTIAPSPGSVENTKRRAPASESAPAPESAPKPERDGELLAPY